MTIASVLVGNDPPCRLDAAIASQDPVNGRCVDDDLEIEMNKFEEVCIPRIHDSRQCCTQPG